MFKNRLSVIPHNGGYAVAIDNEPTGQIFDTEPKAKAEVVKIKAARKAKRETRNTKRETRNF